jgi:Ca2+-binding EF-hand superfamily protein/DNA repair exonuclease SbcCD ATPase subunit
MSATMDEDRYLNLQNENRRLKKELDARENKHKQTLARLARAEEAAKRATLASSSKLGGSAGGKMTAPTAARLFAAEQRAAELEEESRELTRKLQKEHEKTVHFKNLCKEYKVKLDDALKMARGIKPGKKTAADISNVRLPKPPGMDTSTRHSDSMAEQLRQERVRASTLTSEVESLRRQLRQMELKKGSAPAAAPATKVTGDTWVLEHFVEERRNYLLDRATSKVYTKPLTPDEWPEPVGRMSGGRIVRPTSKDDVFVALDAYLKREQIHLKEAFDKFDADKSESLTTAELGKFLEAVMPGVKPAQQKYFRAMVDINSDGKVTYQELVDAMKNCVVIGEKTSDSASSEMRPVLKKLRSYIKAKLSTLSTVFNQFDKDGSGTLEPRELGDMFTKLDPNITEDEKRHLLSHMARLDLDGDGRVTLLDLKKALRGLDMTIESSEVPAITEMSRPVATPQQVMQVGAGTLVLKEQFIQGQMFLVDSTNSFVYNTLTSPTDWLKPVGKISGGVINRPPTSADLVASLDATLKKQQARLKDVFDSFDTGKKGTLQSKDLSAMLKKLMPGSSDADLAFFQLLLDTAGVGKISYQELVTCIKDVIAASQASSERGNMDAERVLQQFKVLARDKSLFGSGRMSYAKVLEVFRKSVGSGAQESRMVASFVRQLDLGNTGKVGYDEIAHALRVLETRVLTSDGTTPSSGVPQPRQGGPSDWYLEDITLDGAHYLVDRHTMRVYTPPAGAGQWPELAGRFMGGRLVPFERNREQRFVAGLDKYLKDQHARLKDVFDTFDRERTGALTRSDVSVMIRALLPDATAGDVQYIRTLLDIDSDGEVSFTEFVNGVKDAIAASNNTHNKSSPELSAVLKILTDYVSSRGISLAQAFDEFDSAHTGFLTHNGLIMMLRKLIPNLSNAELKHMAHHLREMDADGDGRVTLAEVYQALRMSEVKRVVADPSRLQIAAAPAAANTAEMANLREQAGEVAYLRKQLSDTKALVTALEIDLKREKETAIVPKYPRNDDVSTSFSAGELQAEIKSAWERAGVLQKRYQEAQQALGTMKANHTKVLQQLDETHKRLNAERRENLNLASEEKRLAMELEAARELEPLLEQARHERLALEKENHQLLAAAMNAPSEAQSEVRRLRSIMVEAQRERAAAELREAELKRTLNEIGGGGVEDYKSTRSERDRLRVDMSRMEVELEAAHDKIKVFMEMGGASHKEGKGSKAGSKALIVHQDDDMDEGTLRAELRGLRETYADQVEELKKAQKLLKLEEHQGTDLRAALVEEKTRADKINEDLYRKVQAHENELDRRQKKIQKLEAQLRRLLSGGSIEHIDEGPKTVRSSMSGSMQLASKAEESDTSDLGAGENIFELRLLGVEIDRAVIGEPNPATFMTVDFFEHETQATAVVTGTEVEIEQTLQYIVKVDDFFLEYLDTKRLPVELNKSLGLDFATIGVAHIQLAKVLDDMQLGHTAKDPSVHFCDVVGRNGDIIARVRYSAFLRKSVMPQLRAYKAKPGAVGARARLPPGTDPNDPLASAYTSAYEAAASANFVPTAIKVDISCCRDLVPRVGETSDMVPYCSYQFPGLPSHDTTYGRGPNPDFEDSHDMPLERTKEVEARLENASMEVVAFDDADTDLEGAGVIGIARIDLEPLSKGLPVQGAFPLFSQSREKMGTVYVSLSWKEVLQDASRSAKSAAVPTASDAARVSAPPRAPRRSAGIEDDNLSKALPTSPMSTALTRQGGPVTESVMTSASAADKVTVSIGQLELGNTLYHDHKIRQMFMLFEFMSRFHRDDDQQTMRVKKQSSLVDFGYTRAFPVKEYGLRKALAAALRGGSSEEAIIPFCLVSDDNGIDFEDVGFFELKLSDIYEKGDILDRRVQVLDKNDAVIGHVTVSISGQSALQSIMADP